MNRKYRPVFVFAISTALLAPYFWFVVYYWQRFASGHWPSWFTNVIAIWFIANFMVLMLLIRLTRKLFKNENVDAEKAQIVVAKALRTGARLVIFWSLLFVYGLVQTARGKIPIERAIPAGAFLLFFIVLFGWSMYRARRPKKSTPTSLTKSGVGVEKVTAISR
jgi:hypothetical protein